MRLSGYTFLALMLGIQLKILCTGDQSMGGRYLQKTAPSWAFRHVVQEKVSPLVDSPDSAKPDDAALREAVVDQFRQDLSHMRWTWNNELERDDTAEARNPATIP